MTQEQLTAEKLAMEIREVARKAHSEEDVRLNVEHVLSHALEALGIQREAQYEKSLFSGSADAVYGHVLVEYKRPGRLAEKGFTKTLASQIGKYLFDLARKESGRELQATALEKMVGVGLDGEQIMFMRYSASGRKRELPTVPMPGTQYDFFDVKETEGAIELKGGFQIIGPVPVGKESIELFLLFLRSLSRKPLTPESLALAFGPQSEVARSVVNALYYSLETYKEQPKVATFFAEWQRIFGIVYGEEMTDAEKDALELAALYGNVKGKSVRLQPMFFAVHTYYALLMKFLAVEFAALQRGALVDSFVTVLPALPDERVRRELEALENGGTFALLGINNFLEGDFFGWYLSAWDDGLGRAIRQMARELANFEPATGTLDPEHTRDLLKKLYQYLIPKKLRHDLGEYYTPDWLAERLLRQMGYDGDIKKRLLDPACGSGTFPILALGKLRQWTANRKVEPAKILKAALDNIVGFDLNPLSVIASRTNFLLALGDLLRYRESNIDLPIYLCDSVLTPTESYGDMFKGQGYSLRTVVGNFEIPSETIESREMSELAKLLEECVKNNYAEKDFMARAKQTLSMKQSATEILLESLYRRFLYLDREGRNGIWARLIKNAFAPIFVGKFDFVAGNPPWVNWESLSQEYRNATKKLWEDYGLFTLKGHAARLGGGKKDLSMLFTYVSADKYLKPKGKLGFVITQTVFKTKGAGDGFRRFRIGDKEPVNILAVDDMVELQPFEGASNWTAVFVMQKGMPMKYPVPYLLWRIKKGKRIDLNASLEAVIAATERVELKAQPIDPKSPSSPWITARSRSTRILTNAMGKSDYRAKAGACTWADGVYWLKILEKRPDGLLIVENMAESGKREIPHVRAVIEAGLLYPFVEWKAIKRFKATPTQYILMVQDPEKRVGYEESKLKMEFHHTYAYLKQFENVLRKRSGFIKYFNAVKDPFYSMYNISADTFAPFKVVWRTMGSSIDAAVLEPINSEVGKKKVLIHKNTVMSVALTVKDEAHYLCAVLNSAVTNFIAKSYSVKGGKSFGSANLLEFIRIPKFQSSKPLHVRLADLSKQAHMLTEKGKDVSGIDADIDKAAAKLWGMSESELAEIKKSLSEM